MFLRSRQHVVYLCTVIHFSDCRASFRFFEGRVPNSTSGGRGHIVGQVPDTNYPKSMGAYATIAAVQSIYYGCQKVNSVDVYKI